MGHQAIAGLGQGHKPARTLVRSAAHLGRHGSLDVFGGYPERRIQPAIDGHTMGAVNRRHRRLDSNRKGRIYGRARLVLLILAPGGGHLGNLYYD